MSSLPHKIEEDEGIEAEPTKVGGNALAVQEAIRAAMTAPNDKATSKMNAFDLELALERAAETAAESGTRATLPFPAPEPMIEATRQSSVEPMHAPMRAPMQPPMPATEGSGMRALAILATFFVVIACAILLHH